MRQFIDIITVPPLSSNHPNFLLELETHLTEIGRLGKTIGAAALGLSAMAGTANSQTTATRQPDPVELVQPDAPQKAQLRQPNSVELRQPDAQRVQLQQPDPVELVHPDAQRVQLRQPAVAK